jgi:hypothetical protein
MFNGQRKTMKTLYVALALVILLPCQLRADQPRLSANQEKQLVMAALPLKLKQLPAFELEPYVDPSSHRFDFFQATWAGTPNGSVIVGHYAVDPKTGDVFDAVVGCSELSTPALRKLQDKDRAQLGLSDARYHKIRSNGPLC